MGAFTKFVKNSHGPKTFNTWNLTNKIWSHKRGLTPEPGTAQFITCLYDQNFCDHTRNHALKIL